MNKPNYDPKSKYTWRTSSYTNGDGECVEIAELDGGVAVRDTKNREAGALLFNDAEWTAFLRGVHDGEFDRTT